MYLERAAVSRAERCERRRACGSRVRGGRAGARLERAAASRAERAAARAGGVAGGRGRRRWWSGARVVLRDGPYRRFNRR